jgi:hypothetical protein
MVCGSEESERALDKFDQPVASHCLAVARPVGNNVCCKDALQQGEIPLPIQHVANSIEKLFELHAINQELQFCAHIKKLAPLEVTWRVVRVIGRLGWIIEQAGPEIRLFSSDYPHVEGGRRPIERFGASLDNASEEIRRRFYCDDFLDLMGSFGAHLAR